LMVGLAIVALAMVAGCHTIAGAGEDVFDLVTPF